MNTPTAHSLATHLKALRLSTMAQQHQDIAREAERGGWTFGQYLHHLCELEVQARGQRRIQRHLKASRLPREKTLASLEMERLPVKVRRTLPRLCEGDFVDKAQNVLAFGLPGRGKTHVLCAIGHALIHRGYKVLFTPAAHLVQRLLRARRDLRLEKELARLDRFEAVCIDDIGYVQHNRDEMEVLFTFFAERYERRSVLLSSNLVFSQWDRIFKDPMTTAAAIDRLVHHATILELVGPSYRSEHAEHLKSAGVSPTDDSANHLDVGDQPTQPQQGGDQ